MHYWGKVDLLRRWARSPWVTFAVLVNAIMLPMILVFWLVGRVSENERAALQQAYYSLRQREMDWVLERATVKMDFLFDDPAGKNSMSFGYLLDATFADSDRSSSVSASVEQAQLYIDDLRYLMQAFGPEAAIEQIWFWLEEKSLDGLVLGGGRNLKLSLLLYGAELDSATDYPFVDLLKAELLQIEGLNAVGIQQVLFLIQELKRFERLDKELELLSNYYSNLWAFTQLTQDTIDGLGESMVLVQGMVVSRRFAGEDENEGWFWFVGYEAFETWLLREESGANAEQFDLTRFKLLDPSGVVEDREGLTVVGNLDGRLQGWRIVSSIEEEDLLMPARERTLNYLTITFVTVSGSILFSILGMNLVRREITLSHLRNELAATVSHELKTPVASVRLLVDTLLESSEPRDEKTREYLEIIRNENARLGSLIEKFLTFSRMERGSLAFEWVEVDGNQLIQQAENIFRERFLEGDYQLNVDLDADNPTLYVDSQAILSAIGNLLENAYKYTLEPRNITLRLRSTTVETRIEVEDNGLGITPIEQKRIFRRFYQLNRKQNSNRGGVGLGLSIVMYVVKQHKAMIELESEPGKGSKFIIVIPHAKNSHH